jgi:excisionase family DNA binding protein
MFLLKGRLNPNRLGRQIDPTHKGDNMAYEAGLGEQKIWCPVCEDHYRFLRIPTAAKLLEVSRRTIYRHIEDGSIHVFKLARTGRYRVCSGCLVAQHAGPVKNQIPLINPNLERQKRDIVGH